MSCASLKTLTYTLVKCSVTFITSAYTEFSFLLILAIFRICNKGRTKNKYKENLRFKTDFNSVKNNYYNVPDFNLILIQYKTYHQLICSIFYWGGECASVSSIHLVLSRASPPFLRIRQITKNILFIFIFLKLISA